MFWRRRHEKAIASVKKQAMEKLLEAWNGAQLQLAAALYKAAKRPFRPLAIDDRLLSFARKTPQMLSFANGLRVPLARERQGHSNP